MPEPHRAVPSPGASSPPAPADGDKSDDTHLRLAAPSPVDSSSPAGSPELASILDGAIICQSTSDVVMAEAELPTATVDEGDSSDVEPPSPAPAAPAPPAVADTPLRTSNALAATPSAGPPQSRPTLSSRPASCSGLRRGLSSGLTTPGQSRSLELGAAAADLLSASPLLGTTPSTSQTPPLHTLPPERPLSLGLSDLHAASETKDCLYPGSTFIGTQKSGRNSYDVELQIMDVNLADSTCTGSLKICGLTVERPELTTFFEGELIGPRFGFLTNKWEATKSHDLSHWQRFPLFRPLLPRVRKTDDWTMPSPFVPLAPGGPEDLSSSSERFLGPQAGAAASDCSPGSSAHEGGLFMRFKEKCLLPDYRIKSISGASFEGFYYICLEFDPAADRGRTDAVFDPARGIYQPSASRSGATSRADSSRATTPAGPLATATATVDRSTSPHLQSLSARASSAQGAQSTAAARFMSQLSSVSGRSSRARPSRTPTPRPVVDGKDVEWGAGVMTGFYFHVKNSEPFQELSLRHVKEDVRPTFQFC